MALFIPLLLLGVALYGVSRGVDVFDALVCGAKEGLAVVYRMVPALVVMLTVIAMLRASGAMEAVVRALAPALQRVGVLPECVPLMLLRPFSGSGALALGAELMAIHGPDSPVGLTTSLILGSTETTFYVLAVYAGAAGITRTRYALLAALLADITSYAVATILV